MTTTDQRGLCFDCNYSLQGLDSTRCPECGRPFNPGDLRTMNMSGPLGPISRWALRPTRWVWPVGAVTAVAMLLICNWLVADMIASLIALWLCVGLVVLASMPKMALRNRAIRRFGLPPEFRSVDGAAARKLHKTLWIVSGAMLLRLPLMLVFLVSLPSLSRVATHEWAEVPFDSPRPENAWIGLFPVKSVSVGASGVTFDLRGGVRLQYLPNPPRDVHSRHRKIFGDWYAID